jgi:Amt family ammonium transporter
VVCFWAATSLKKMIGYDDSLDVFGVHPVGGIVGAILTGIFAVGVLSATTAAPEGVSGLLYGNPGQLWIQIKGIVVTMVYGAVASFIILKVLDAIMGLRVAEEAERDGLDLALHGETIQ